MAKTQTITFPADDWLAGSAQRGWFNPTGYEVLSSFTRSGLAGHITWFSIDARGVWVLKVTERFNTEVEADGSVVAVATQGDNKVTIELDFSDATWTANRNQYIWTGRQSDFNSLNYPHRSVSGEFTLDDGQGTTQLPVAAAPTVVIDPVAAGNENTTFRLTATVSGGTYDGDLEHTWTVSGGTLDDATAASPVWTRPTVAQNSNFAVNLSVTARGTGTIARTGTSDVAKAAEVTAAVRNVVVDTTAPVLQSAAVNGATLVLTYDEALGASTPAVGDFNVQVAGSRRTVSSVAVSGSVVTLTLSSAVTNGQTVTLSYTAGTNPIEDGAGNDAANLSDEAVTNNTPAAGPTDTTAPTFSSAQTNTAGTTVTLTFNEALDSGATPGNGRFNVQVAGSRNNITRVSISGSTVVLTLTTAVAFGQTVTVAYTTPGGANALQDAAGNDVATFGAQAVTNRVSRPVVTRDTTPPVLQTATINGDTIVLTYNEALDPGSIPAPGDFSLSTTPAIAGVVGGSVPSLLVPLADASRSQFLSAYSTATASQLRWYDVRGGGQGSPAAGSSALTDHQISGVSFQTPDGTAMVVANGSDKIRYSQNGGAFIEVDADSTPSIMGVDTSNLSYVWAYKNRLFFIEKDSPSIWYLPVGNVGGQLSRLSLTGVFPFSSELLFGTSLGMEAGDTLDERLVVMSKSGYCAIYAGDVGATEGSRTFRLEGVYNVGIPLGQNCHFKHGDDLYIGVTDGLVSLLSIIKQKALSRDVYLSRALYARWPETTRVVLPGYNWRAAVWSARNLAFVYNGQFDTNRVIWGVNLRSGAWFEFDFGLAPVIAFAEFEDEFFALSNDGSMYLFVSGSDDGEAINCLVRFTPHLYERRVSEMGIRLAWRGDFVANKVTLASTCGTPVPDYPPPRSGIENRATWSWDKPGVANDVAGNARWGTSKWLPDAQPSSDVGGGYLPVFKTAPVLGAEELAAPTVQATVRQTDAANFELTRVDVRLPYVGQR